MSRSSRSPHVARFSPGVSRTPALASALLVAVLCGCSGSSSERSERPAPPFVLVEGEPLYTVLPVDAIPAIDAPTFVDVATAAAFMTDEEPVLGVVGADGAAKCYSAWHLEEHEIVNDELDGVAIAATW